MVLISCLLHYDASLQNAKSIITQFCYKMRQNVLQNASSFSCKIRQLFYNLQLLLQNTSILLQNAAVISSCDIYYRMCGNIYFRWKFNNIFVWCNNAIIYSKYSCNFPQNYDCKARLDPLVFYPKI